MTEPFTTLRGSAIPMLRDNVDTDTISPGSPPPRKGSGTAFGERGSSSLADDLFANWRYDADGEPRPDFAFNQPRYAGARILVAGANFGCGSSRESAVWMLSAWGIGCIIAPSFAEIFSANCFANGVLPIALPMAEVISLAREAELGARAGQFTVNLARSEIQAPSGRTIGFSVSAFLRRGLMTGQDAIAVTLESSDLISSFVTAKRAVQPWLYRN